MFDDEAVLICAPMEESDVCYIFDPARRYIARKSEKLVNSGIGPNTMFNWNGKAYQCGIQKWEALIRFDVLSSLYGNWDRWDKYLNSAVNTTSHFWLDSNVFSSSSIEYFHGRDPQPVPDELGINFIISIANMENTSDNNQEVIFLVLRYYTLF